ncbi:MAG: DUF2306 domain-containing protein [Cyclobacteriaceae bacterium]
MVKRLLYIIFALLGVALAFNALSYSNFDPTYKFLRLKQTAIETGWYLPAYYSHVLISAVILIIGFVQVLKSIRKHWPKIHRYLGMVYIMGILFFAAPGGFVMSLFINRGPWVLASFITQCTLWFYFTVVAYQKARSKDFESHEHWIWRSFALTLAAITLRIYIFIFSFSTDLSQASGYALLAWLSWVPNLLIVEAWFYLKRKSKIQFR